MITNDRWRDSYDAWKLATPPEHEADPRACPICDAPPGEPCPFERYDENDEPLFDKLPCADLPAL